MINVLLISSSADNIKVSWRYFCTNDYSAEAAVGNDKAMEALKASKKGTVPVFYCGNATNCFIDFYRKLRADEKTANIPLVVLADIRWTKVLSEYVHLVNTLVVGSTVSGSKLNDIMKTASRGGFEKQNAPRSSPHRKPR
ncbi:MAG TPA: hypothetical protein DDX91_10210 [Ruminococcaceae bacterium]|nr:hypothetical protein [Oscillospiraceae bacterium]